jgi:RNA polymerase sigma-70 factor (ECF subfamily)
VAVQARDVDSDATLVFAAQNGDRDAFAELFRRHYPAIHRTCARRLSDSREADEVAQAAFVRAWERIDRCNGDRRFGGWVQVIANHMCIDALRDRGRMTPTEIAESEVRAPLAEGPEDVVLRGETTSLVKLALADLPKRQRDVVVARHLEDRRPGEIAAALGLSIGAVDSLLQRGRRRLAAAVERLSGDGGAISTASASSVAAVGTAGSGRVSNVIQSAQHAVERASYHVAASLGLVPGVQGTLQKAVAAAAVSGAIAAGAAAPHAAPAHPIVPPVPPVQVPSGLRAGANLAKPLAPALSHVTLPAVNTSLPALPALPKVAEPTVDAPSIPAPADLLHVVTNTLDAVTGILHNALTPR